MTKEDFKTCPFCGSNDVFLSNLQEYPGVRFVTCCSCGTDGPTGGTKTAVTNWNRRSDQSNKTTRKEKK